MTTTINKNTKSASNKSASGASITPLFATDYNVYINHTDAGGIVYHANHLVFFENCRRDWFTKIGINRYFLQTDNGDVQHFVVSQADLQYKRAVLLDEVIDVRIDNVELKPASIIFYQSIHRQTSSNDSTDKTNTNDSLLSRAKIVIACVQNQVTPESIANDDKAVTHSAPMRPIRVPQKLHDAIEDAINQHVGK